jgi:branched-chain amino acid aminotransferase
MTEPNFADRDGWIWHNGKLVPWRDAKVHVLTHTLHYGVGVFEGVRAYATPEGPCIFRVHEHTQRLFDSAHILGLKIPYTPEEVTRAQLEVVAANDLPEGYLRPMVYLGSEAMGLRAKDLSVNLCIAARPWPEYMDPDSREKGITVRTSSFTRQHVNITMCKAKANGNYINTIFYLADEMGVNIKERRITRDEVYICDEAFFTGTAAEVLPIRELDGRVIGTGERGPLTERFQSAYFAQVRGQRDAFPEWLTPLA